MKKFLKKGIICILSLFVGGCTIGYPKDEDKGRKNLTKEEFSQKLVTLNSNMDNVKQFTIKGNSKADMLFISTDMEYEISVDLENNKYFSIEKDDSGKVLSSEYVIKSNDDYIKYAYEGDYFDEGYEDYSTYYVGSDYILNAVKTNGCDINSLDMTSYEGFRDSFEKIVIDSDILEESYLSDYDKSIELYEEDNIYYFSYLLNEESVEDGQTVKTTVSSIFKFDEEFIVGIDISAEIEYIVGGASSTMLFSDNSTYSRAFDNNLMLTDFSSYPTDIEPASFSVYYILDGEEDSFGESDTYKEGEIFVPNYYEDEIENTTLDGWYLDENCTISATTLTDYPSYDLYLYANTKPNENYALITLIGSLTNASGWEFGPEIIEKKAVSVNEGEYLIPETVDVYGNEGNVISVKVNGETYTENSIILENKGVYIIEVEAIDEE